MIAATPIFLTVRLEITYLRRYWADFDQIFGTGTCVGGYDQSDLFAIA